jgi:hypothetical protein
MSACQHGYGVYSDGECTVCNPELLKDRIATQARTAFEKIVVIPLGGKYDQKQYAQDFAMFSLGYQAGADEYIPYGAG